MEMHSPTCLLFCLVFNRTICRMLEFVMSETMSATRFQTRNREPQSMWYCFRRMPSQHSWPISFCLHLPFLTHTRTHKMQQPLTNLFKIFEHSSKICLFGGDFSNHEYFVNAECLSLQLALHLGQHNTMSTVQCHASRVLVNGT